MFKKNGGGVENVQWKNKTVTVVTRQKTDRYHSHIVQFTKDESAVKRLVEERKIAELMQYIEKWSQTKLFDDKACKKYKANALISIPWETLRTYWLLMIVYQWWYALFVTILLINLNGISEIIESNENKFNLKFSMDNPLNLVIYQN